MKDARAAIRDVRVTRRAQNAHDALGASKSGLDELDAFIDVRGAA